MPACNEPGPHREPGSSHSPIRPRVGIPSDVPHLVSVREAARTLNVSERTVQRLCEENKLTCVRVRSQWRIDLRPFMREAGLL